MLLDVLLLAMTLFSRVLWSTERAIQEKNVWGLRAYTTCSSDSLNDTTIKG